MIARFLWLAALLAVTAPAGAGERAADWLMRINDAARHQDYDGVFVYLRGRQLETLRIVHKVDGRHRRERLISLTGTPREIIRTDEMVICYLPDESSVVTEHRKTSRAGFPAILPERLAIMERYYRLRLGDRGRVAGREAQVVLIEPRDALRFGYRLWADRQSGLLLRSDLLDSQGQMLEQFMFTHLVTGREVSAEALKPQTQAQGYRWHRESLDPPAAATAPRWDVRPLPPGFRLASYVHRRSPVRQVAVEHLVYSDGLATVSVFVERLPERGAIQGPSRLGAVHAYGRQVNGHQVTVVGEVPAETVRRFAGALVPAAARVASP